MWPRIGLLMTGVVVFAGFRAPVLPSLSRGVYRLEPPATGGMALRTADGAVFSLAIGFKADAQTAQAKSLGHRDQAQALIERVSAILRSFEERRHSSEIAIARVYPTTREVVLNVVVRDAAKVDKIRSILSALFIESPDVVFAGEAGSASIE